MALVTTEVSGVSVPSVMSEYTLLHDYMAKDAVWNITDRNDGFIEFTRISDSLVVRVFVPTS